MINIVIVEDEIYALKSLKQKIVDIGWPFNVVGEAFNGENALGVIAEVTPDIVITDIKMPLMGGIDLIKQLRNKFPQIIPVIVSGYQEFDYARQAIKLDVDDFLLKPIEMNELNKCLQKCREKIDEERKKRDYENIISAMLNKEVTHVEKMGETWTYEVMYLIIGNCINYNDSILHSNYGYVDKAYVERIIKTEEEWALEGWCFDGSLSNEKVIIFKDENMNDVKIQDIATKLKDKLFYDCGLPITITISSKTKNINNIRMLINEARKNSIRGLILGKSQILLTSQDTAQKNSNKEGCKVKSIITNEFISGFFLLIDSRQYLMIKKELSKLFKLWEEKDLPLYNVEKSLIFLLNSMQSLRMATKEEEELSNEVYIESLILESKSFEELFNRFHNLIIDLFSNVNNDNSKYTTSIEIVEYAEVYLKNNLSKSVTLQELSDKLGISQVYLCRVFKKHKNMSPIDSFIRLKVEKAKDYIRNYPELIIKDIAENLGFNDAYYFSKVFKKLEKMSPSEFKAKS